MAAPVPEYHLVYGWNDKVQVQQGPATGLPPYIQEPPFPAPAPDAPLKLLQRQYLGWQLEQVLPGVESCGGVLDVLLGLPPWTSSSALPETLVEPLLPDADTGQVGWREQSLGAALAAPGGPSPDLLALQQRVAARAPSSDTWRGYRVTAPFLPGGEVADGRAPGSRAAAAEASSGLWLAQLEAAEAAGAGGGAEGGVEGALALPRVAAPGLMEGLLGGWAAPDDLVPAGDQLAGGVPFTPGAPTTATAPPPAAAAAASIVAPALLLSRAPLLSGGGEEEGAGAAAAAAAAAQEEALKQPGGIFEGLWLLPTEVAPEPSDSEPEDEDAGYAPVTAPAATQQQQQQQQQQQGSALAAAAPDGGCPSSLQQALGEGGDSVDTLLAENASALAAAGAERKAGQAATAAAAAKTKARGAGNLEFAVRGGIPDLASAWRQLSPRAALTWPFELDTFQQEAVLHLEAGHSVFVAAHTSAGKTVVAEYAFALAGAHASRAIYTSPIKTISNQKFRDFSGKFEVGLLTGDVQIRPEASCLIMTTEILRSMLYKGADVIRDVEYVVFDEVHYVNDVDRGVVWEEVIIMLPPHITIVMLSATVPNVMDFADWVGRTKNRVVYVTGTTRRPVPLEHAIYYDGAMYPIMKGETLLPDGLRKVAAAHKARTAPPSGGGGAGGRPTGRGEASGPNRGGGRGGGGGGGGGGGRGYGQRGGSADQARKQVAGMGRSGGPNSAQGSERTVLLGLVAHLRQADLLPVAFFTFSKKRCDAAGGLLGGLDLTTAAEKHTVHVFVEQCLARLKEEDRGLPQILRLRELMRRGIAVHHAGLLPILKEVVEMLFCQGYIKVLFCTETFAMGVNAPTRTVAFHSLRKHDGKAFRYLLPGEYTQMAGRAGRRGLDAVGTVLLVAWEEPPPEGEVRGLLQGRGGALSSRFRLTYNMILNLLRVEDLRVEDMLKRSFAEFHAQRAQPGQAAGLAAGEGQLAALEAAPWPPCLCGADRAAIQHYWALSRQIEELNETVQEAIMSSRAAHALLTPGRVVLVAQPTTGLTELGVVVASPDMSPAELDPDSVKFGGKKGGGGGFGAMPSTGSSSSSSSGGVGPGRVLWLLLLHARDALDPPPGDEGAAAAAAAAVEDEFAGFVRLGGPAARHGWALPGPLPRYGEVAGVAYTLAALPAKQVVGISRTRLKLEPRGVLGQEAPGLGRAAGELAALQRACAALGADPDLVDPRTDLKLNELGVVTALLRRGALMAERAALPPHTCPGTPAQYQLVRSAGLLQQRLARLRHQLSDDSLQQLPEFHQRLEVLKELGYVDPDAGTVLLKGRAACEINSTQDELLATEGLFRGLLTGLDPPEAVALLSALVFQEKSDVEPVLTPALSAARDGLVALATELAGRQAAAGLAVAAEEYVRDVLHMGLMEVVYEWARGTPFAAITALTDVMEGSIVRAVVRLDQACREVGDAARVMGDTALWAQMQAASAAIKRDVVFAASLYVA